GVVITPRQMFRHQTVASLAAASAEPTATPGDPAASVHGPVPLLPMQRWFLDRPLRDRHHFTQSVLVSVAADTDAELLARAIEGLVERHAALRARFVAGPDGWCQHIAAPGGHDPVGCAHVDLSTLPPAERTAALTARCAALKAGMDLDRAPLLRAALFTLDPAGPRRLLLAAHHLVVDAVSWHVLLEDLADGYRRLAGAEPPTPAAPTGSVRDQAEALARYADSAELRTERGYWAAARVDGRPAGSGYGELAGSRDMTVELDEAATTALLTSAGRLPGTRITDVLLAALVTAWRRWTGEPELAVDLEGHGRDEVSAEVDLHRTVGWFTALYPVRLGCPDPDDAAGTLRATSAALRRVPHGGIGFGVLRHLCGELADLPVPQVSFNYLGRFDPAGSAGTLFGPATEDSGPDSGVGGAREHRIEINGGVFGGRLRMTFGYSPDHDDTAAVRRLAEGYLATLADLPGEPVPAGQPGSLAGQPVPAGQFGTGGQLCTGSPVPATDRDRYPLSPLQQGLLFHALTGEEPGQYVVQVELRLRGALRAEVARRVWQDLAARHPVLRTSVHWRDRDEPVQVVHDRVEIGVEEVDCRDDPGRLRDWLAADRAAGFDLAAAPLLRVALVSLADESHVMVVTSHHIILDGWSSARLLAEFFTGYARAAVGRVLDAAPARPFGDYLDWLAAQDRPAADRYWRRRLAGFTQPTRIGGDADAPDQSGARTVDLVVTLPEDRTARLVEFARREHLTLSTVLHTAWAVVLGRHTGTDDVVFGSTVSGRPPELPGVESMLGLFINTLPVRVALPHDGPVRDVLRQAQDDLLELRDYEYSSLADAQRVVGLPAGQPLFDSILVIENYPAPTDGEDGGLTVEQVSTREQTSYPLTVAVTVGRELLVRLSYRPDRWDATGARWLVDQLLTALESMAAHPERPTGRVDVLAGDELRAVRTD
ncbi:MAG: condensation domain-containing protein, partial [Actinocatenispora sp.]